MPLNDRAPNSLILKKFRAPKIIFLATFVGNRTDENPVPGLAFAGIRRLGSVNDMTSSLVSTDALLSPIERPRCLRCRTRMNLASLAARSDRSEKRTFECPHCDFTETRVVADPLVSEAVHRLADNIRPPT